MSVEVRRYVEERDGNLYAEDSRVTVSSIVGIYNVHHYMPEDIHRAFPTLSLATIFGVLAYYFDHQQELDEQFAHEEARADQWRQRQNNDPNSMHNIVRRRIEEARQPKEDRDETDLQ